MPDNMSSAWYWDSRGFFGDDGQRRKHRIDYERIPIPGYRDVDCDATYYQCDHWDPAVRLKARKRMWRRIRTGYYDRQPAPVPVRWDDKGRKIVLPGHRGSCGARCRSGRPCKLLAVTNKYTGKLSTRCRLHGGHSTGPRTEDGKAAALAALARHRQRNRLGAEMSE